MQTQISKLKVDLSTVKTSFRNSNRVVNFRYIGVFSRLLKTAAASPVGKKTLFITPVTGYPSLFAYPFSWKRWESCLYVLSIYVNVDNQVTVFSKSCKPIGSGSIRLVRVGACISQYRVRLQILLCCEIEDGLYSVSNKPIIIIIIFTALQLFLVTEL